MDKRWILPLLVIALFIIAGLIVAVIVLSVISRDQREELASHGRKSDLCMTQACVKLAARIGSAMNMSADPCEDFYQFACGRWPEGHPIPDDLSYFSTFSALDEEVFAKLKVILNSPVEGPAAEKVQTLFNACMDLDAINAKGTAPMTALLEAVGGWPVLGAPVTSDLERLIADVHLRNSRALLYWDVAYDEKNSSVHVLYIDQPYLGLYDRDYFLDPKFSEYLEAYRKFAKRIAVLLGADREIAERDMDDMVDFEIQVANLTMPLDQRRNMTKLYNRMTLQELSTRISPRLDWVRHVNLMFGETTTLVIPDNEPVVVWSSAYVTNVLELVARTPNRTVTNYVVWRLVHNVLIQLGQDFMDAKQQFDKVVRGTKSIQPRWKKCVDLTKDCFKHVVGRLFVDKHFQGSSREDVLEMLGGIMNVMKETLKEEPWMDQHTRSVAIEKAEAIVEKIAYPHFTHNDTYLEELYRTVTPKPDQHFNNVLNVRFSRFQQDLMSLREPVDKSQWFTSASTVNAYYSPSRNQIIFPAGILQPPFYHKDYPRSVNYGGIGGTIGHEITHGFDDKGRQYDKDGNVKQWWSYQSIENFKEKAQCIIEQYGNYTVPEVGLNLKGAQTQGENIADNGAAKLSFIAYRRYVDEVRKKEEEPRLPGLPFTNNQLLFISWAQIWCHDYRKQALEQQITAGSHSPPRYRVIGPMSNSAEFAKAFNCPLDSPMNPRKKCEVW